MKEKDNVLLNSVLSIFEADKRGRVLDLGCGDGDYSWGLKKLGYDVVPCDMDSERFRFHDEMLFKSFNIINKLPFEDQSFDYILLMEVIEHLPNPYEVMEELSRILKKGGVLIVSTPNILSLKSRFRYLVEGSYEYYREPPLDLSMQKDYVIWNLHIIPWRYHELEYLLLPMP